MICLRSIRGADSHRVLLLCIGLGVQPVARMTKSEFGVSQIRYIAAVARYKLRVQCAKEDMNFRVVVGHANFLDFLEAKLGESQSIRKDVFDCKDRVIEQREWSETELETVEEGDEGDEDSGSDTDSSDSEEDYSVDNPQFYELCGEWNSVLSVLIEPW